MRRNQPPARIPSNGVLAALAGGVLVLGAGFLYAYDTLRSDPVTIGAAALASSAASSFEAGDSLATDEASALSELGIDPDAADLSPQARAAILRAHRAAQANAAAPGAPSATEGDAVDGEQADGGTVPGDDLGAPIQVE